jgi:MEMO1 family protein
MRVKRGTLAGSWYPSDPDDLRGMIGDLLAAAPVAPGERLLGVVVPHAGYAYSGAVAAAGYRALAAASFERVVLLAPSHRGAFHGAVVLDADAFETPLGRIGIDPAALELVDGRTLRVDEAPFHGEHSLEIQLPWIQRVLPDTRVIPLLLGSFRPRDDETFGEMLSRLVGPRTALVVSSDFTHYGWRFDYQPFPASGPEEVRSALRQLDMGAIEPILRGDAAAFLDYIARTGDTVCGRVPIAALLHFAGARVRGRLLEYRTSLDVTGDYEHSVSYAAIAFPQRD